MRPGATPSFERTRENDPQVLKVLIEHVGSERIVMGSDYPVGEKDPVAWLWAAGLAARLLGLGQQA